MYAMLLGQKRVNPCIFPNKSGRISQESLNLVFEESRVLKVKHKSIKQFMGGKQFLEEQLK